MVGLFGSAEAYMGMLIGLAVVIAASAILPEIRNIRRYNIIRHKDEERIIVKNVK